MEFVKKDGFDFCIDVEKFVKSDLNKSKARYYLTGKGVNKTKIMDVDLKTNKVLIHPDNQKLLDDTFLLSDYCMIIAYQN